MRRLRLGEVYVIGRTLDPQLCGLHRARLRVTCQLPSADLPPGFASVEGDVLSGLRAGQHLAIGGVRLRRYDPKVETCRCTAYEFPHHKGKGSCQA